MDRIFRTIAGCVSVSLIVVNVVPARAQQPLVIQLAPEEFGSSLTIGEPPQGEFAQPPGEFVSTGAPAQASPKPAKTPKPAAGPRTSNQSAAPVDFAASAPGFNTLGPFDKCGYSACNPPPQPQVAGGRCAPCISAIDCASSCGMRLTWRDAQPYPFQPLKHGEYLGPIRIPSTIDYRLRVGDQIRFVYGRSRDRLIQNYRLRVGDRLAIRSVTDADLKMGDINTGFGVDVQPDGLIYLHLIGGVRAAGYTVPQLRHNLENLYKDKINDPAIDIQPIRTNTPLDDIIESVSNRTLGQGQVFTDTVHPDGTIRLMKLGAVCVQGMTLDEVKREVNLRYSEIVAGLEVEPVLDQEAQHFVWISGEVTEPGRFQMLGPTSVSQALALAKGIKVGGNSRQVVVFRRAEDWRLLATKLDIRGEHLGRVPNPADEIWLRDNDLIIVPPTPIKLFDNFVRQVFTEGIYGIVPFQGISISQIEGGSISAN